MSLSRADAETLRDAIQDLLIFATDPPTSRGAYDSLANAWKTIERLATASIRVPGEVPELWAFRLRQAAWKVCCFAKAPSTREPVKDLAILRKCQDTLRVMPISASSDSAIDNLIAFVQADPAAGIPKIQASRYLPFDGQEYRELQRLDAEFLAECQRAGLSMPDYSPEEASIQPYGAARIPSRPGKTAMLVSSTPAWEQAMLGLKALAKAREREGTSAPLDQGGPGQAEGRKPRHSSDTCNTSAPPKTEALTGAAKVAYNFLLRLKSKGKRAPAKMILSELKKKGFHLTASSLRRHIMPRLAISGVKNDRDKSGYYIP